MINARLLIRVVLSLNVTPKPAILLLLRASLLLGAGVAVLPGCASTPPVNAHGVETISSGVYQNLVEANTRRRQEYSGLFNTMDVTATLLDSKLLEAQLKQKARLLQWDPARLQQEKNGSDEKKRDQTRVFLSFFTPEKKNDDLGKKSTQWRLYLEAGGRRWEGRAVKLRDPVAEIQGLYPHYSRLATPYLVTFPVGTPTFDQGGARFTITGPMGIVTLEY